MPSLQESTQGQTLAYFAGKKYLILNIFLGVDSVLVSAPCSSFVVVQRHTTGGAGFE